ncbi:hypothetical protein ACL00O_16560 [Aeromonas sanarellii]
MATGIFSTTRVAGEGVAIAIVGALVTLFIQMHLPQGSAAATIETARQLAMGNVAAASQVSNESAQALIRAYGDAFQWLIYVLMLVTVGSGVVVGWLLDEAIPAPQYDLNRQRAN